MSFSRAAQLATRQHGLITFDQLLGLGCPASTLKSWVTRGHLERIAPEIYRIAGTPPTWHQRVMTACLSTSGLASHRTAAALRGLDGFSPAIVEVSVPRWERRHRATFTVHETKDLVSGDADRVKGIPCTSLVRTVVDLPQVCSADHAGQALDDAWRRHEGILVPVRQRFIEVARRGRPGTRKMRLMLSERLGEDIPTASTFEKKMLRLIRDAGLPEPEKQYHVRFDNAPDAFLDLAWPPHRVGVECDSLAYHSGKRAHTRDRARRRRLQLAGWDIYEYTYDDVTKHGPTVVKELRAALKSQTGVRQGHISGLPA